MPSDVAIQLEFILFLIVAAVLGAAIGAQREMHGAPAGMRTHLLVSLGSAMFTIISAHGFLGLVAPVDQNQATAYDPTRIAAQVVAGIGFLGAGAILKEGATIRGLTTAASLWTAAAIGMAVGAGEVVFALAGTIIILVSLGPLAAISSRLAPEAPRQLGVRLRVSSLEVIDAVASQLSHHDIEIAGVASTPLEDGRHEVEIQLEVPGKMTVAKVMSIVFSAAGVEAAETVTPTE